MTAGYAHQAHSPVQITTELLDTTMPSGDQPEENMVQYIRLQRKQFPHLSLPTPTLMLLKKVMQAFVEARLAHK